MWEIKAEIRRIVYLSLHDKIDTDTHNFVSNQIVDELYVLIEKRVRERLLENLTTIDQTPLPNCFHQNVPMYYGSNRGINKTDFKMCFKCKRLFLDKNI